MLHTRASSARAGFTLVEMLVVIVIIGVIFPIFAALLIGSYRDAYGLNFKVQANNEMQQALWYMDDTVKVGTAFLTTVPSQYNDPYGPDNAGSAWSYKGTSSTSRVLITQSYATSTNALATGRKPVFTNTPTYNCTTQMYYQPELQFVTIYFVKNGTLYRRLLTDTTTPLCTGNTQAQKQTCPPYLTGTLNALCQANDEVLATNVTNFSVAYYQSSTPSVSYQIDPSYSSSDPSVLEPANYAIVTLTETKSGSNPVSTSLSARLTEVN